MVRKLKYHEEKLLKKVDFINWEVDNNLHEVKIMRKFFIQKREDYTKWLKWFFFNLILNFKNNLFRYNKMSRDIRELVRKIKELDPKDPFRMESTSTLLEKL